MPASRLRAALLNHALAPADDPRPDGELLALFLQRGDEAAFAALVVRHTPAVRAACRTWLRSPADVDDAAQATFLVLVRRAGSVRDPKALPRWLYRVAGNVARRLRKQLTKAGPLPPDIPDRDTPPVDDLADRVAEEVARLPEKYRLPVQLCYAAGLSAAAAAERLGCPRGTVLTRLARGRDLVIRRMAARGAAPAAVLAALPAARAVAPVWVSETTRAAKGLLAGASPAVFGVSERTVTLTEGVVRAMTWKNLRAIAAAAMLTTGLIGFVVGQWASADPSGPPRKPALPPSLPPVQAEAAKPGQSAKADDAGPVRARRREAVIRMPVGTFVKEFEAQPYGSGRIIWTYEEDRVLGRIEVSVMGAEVEVATEAEISMSRHGTIYGLLTSVRVNRFHIPETEEFAMLRPYVGLWPLIEPVIAEMTTDLPFSYQVRQSGDRLSIHNFRMLLAGPNPFGKLGGALGVDGGVGTASAAFSALGVAVEGTYTAADAKELEPLKSQPVSRNPAGRATPSAYYLPPLYMKHPSSPTALPLQPPVYMKQPPSPTAPSPDVVDPAGYTVPPSPYPPPLPASPAGRTIPPAKDQ